MIDPELRIMLVRFTHQTIDLDSAISLSHAAYFAGFSLVGESINCPTIITATVMYRYLKLC